MKRAIAIVLLLTFVFSMSASADVTRISFGNVSSCTAYAIDDLAVRAEPTVDSTYLGSFKAKGNWIEVTGRCWDEDARIWWLYVHFTSNGRRYDGWTGTKRFDPSTYDLYDLPEYELSYDYGYVDDDEIDGDHLFYYRAIDVLALREYPTVDSHYVGTYHVKGDYIDIYARAWDSDARIWWVQVGFYYKGAWVEGWTGVKRFNIPDSDFNWIPIY